MVMSELIELNHSDIGKKYGKLTILDYIINKNNKKQYLWLWLEMNV